jgi:hypothetical protein
MKPFGRFLVYVLCLALGVGIGALVTGCSDTTIRINIAGPVAAPSPPLPFPAPAPAPEAPDSSGATDVNDTSGIADSGNLPPSDPHDVPRDTCEAPGNGRGEQNGTPGNGKGRGDEKGCDR